MGYPWNNMRPVKDYTISAKWFYLVGFIWVVFVILRSFNVF